MSTMIVQKQGKQVGELAIHALVYLGLWLQTDWTRPRPLTTADSPCRPAQLQGCDADGAVSSVDSDRRVVCSSCTSQMPQTTRKVTWWPHDRPMLRLLAFQCSVALGTSPLH